MGFVMQRVELAGVGILQPSVFEDTRGFFKEMYNRPAFEQIGLTEAFVQDNLSRSSLGTVRGLHFQAPPFSQGKLVTVLEGEVLDVVVDLRKGSPTYGQSFSIVLAQNRHTMLYVPPGFAHGFSVLSASCLFYYKCTAVFHKPAEGGIRWNDPDLAIDWRVSAPLVSAKDQDLPFLKDFDSPFSL